MQPGLKRKQQKLSYLERVGENQADRLERDKVGPLVICKSRVNQIIFPLRASRKLRADVDGGGAGPVRNFVSRRRLSFTARLRNRPQLLQDGPRNQFKGLVNCIFIFGQINLWFTARFQIILHIWAPPQFATLQDVLRRPIPGGGGAGGSS